MGRHAPMNDEIVMVQLRQTSRVEAGALDLA
jgi:hypothetical protein